MWHPQQRRQDALVTASVSGSSMEGFFSAVIDSCPENHLLVETNVLVTREK